MKSIALSLCLLLALLLPIKAAAQGEIIFANRIFGSIDAPVYDVDSLTPLAGPGFQARLYAGPAGTRELDLLPVGDAVPFRVNGYIGGYPRFVPGIPNGSLATLQMRVWEASAGSFENARAGAGKYGASAPVTVFLGDLGQMFGLNSFSLVPEPSTWIFACLGLGVGLWHCLRQRKRQR